MSFPRVQSSRPSGEKVITGKEPRGTSLTSNFLAKVCGSQNVSVLSSFQVTSEEPSGTNAPLRAGKRAASRPVADSSTTTAV
jgi:hypothetical protein